ncbi:MAG: methylenetetrahydrofolate--tRNA-(uracil(54)-C(5))-methyltransferase (FADH(2)-oxidizing) TrmFO [Alphaproteobacteria bacterium]
MTKHILHIIGAGLAGSEAAWQAANMGINVTLHEMRPIVKTAAHQTEGCAELVCSNSFRSDDAEHNAVGLLHEEMRRMNSLIMREGDQAAVPAGGALAVDRDIFSGGVTQALENHPNITIERGEVDGLPPTDWEHVIIATGPLTSSPLAHAIQTLTGEDSLAFFDAIAPIVHTESVDMDVAWFQSRYDKAGPAGTGKDYLNCPMNKEQYEAFIDALLTAEYGEFKEWEKDTPYFEGCMPIEVMASRGIETLRFGPMKPVGLTNPHSDERPHAVVQLRQDNELGTLYNIVGFQTKMKYGEQTRIFKMIPGLENAEFARLGGLHRNTFINSPKLLDSSLRLKADPRIRFAGQITGCEGYVESASIGLMAGRFAAAEILQAEIRIPPHTTALGSILNHVSGGANSETFQPMNINFGLFPPPTDEMLRPVQQNGKRKKLKGKDRKKVYSVRALEDLDQWLSNDSDNIKTA